MEDAHDDSQENAPNLKCTKSMFTIIMKKYKATNLLKFQIFLNFACLSVVIQIQGHTYGVRWGVGGRPCYFFYIALSIVVGSAPALSQWSNQEVGVVKGVTDQGFI